MSNKDLIRQQQIRKAQPTPSQVHVNAPLTNISIAYIQSASDFIADKVFPIVPVDKKTDIYWLYTKSYWFKNEAKLRAPGTESAGSGYNVDSTNIYSCDVYAMHHDIPDQVRSNADPGIDVERDATLFVTQRLLILREQLFISQFMNSGVFNNDYAGVSTVPSANQFIQWDDYANSDPISDIRHGRIAIKQQTGFRPNTLVVSEDVFEALRNHPDIVDRYKYTSAQVITADMIARLFEVDRFLIAGAVYDPANEGGVSEMQFMSQKSALLCYSAPNPGLMTPSAGYTFAWRGLSGMGYATSIKNMRMEQLEADRIEGQSAFDFKVVGADLGAFYGSAIS